MDLLRPIEEVWKPKGLSSTPEGQGVGVALVVEAGFRRLRPDVRINFVGAKPDYTLDSALDSAALEILEYV